MITATRAHVHRQAAARLDEALAPVQQALEGVTSRVLEALTDPVARTVVYLIAAGGKRIRPALVLLGGLAGTSPNRHALTETAAAVELIHTATLIHDDIIDRSPLRRSQPTFHYRWGTERAVLMGDYLYATAFALLAALQTPYVVQVMAQVCRQLSRGELREVEARFRLDLTEEEYLAIIGDKTASLISGCCRCGAFLGGGTPDVVERLGQFGVNFGLAFQIVDDCLDLMGDHRQLGKSILADLDKGTLSLPIIYLAQTVTARQRRQLFAPLLGPTGRSWRRSGARAVNPAALSRIAKAAQSTGAIGRARARAQEFVQQAQAALAHVPMNGLSTACQQLAEYAVLRRR